MRKLRIVIVVGTILTAAGLVTAALIRQAETVGPRRCDLRALVDVPRFAWECLTRLVASARRSPRAPGGPDSIPTPADSEPRFAYSTGYFGVDPAGGTDLTITSAGKVMFIPPRELGSPPVPDSWSISGSQVARLTDLFNRLDFMHMRTRPELSMPVRQVTYRYHGMMNKIQEGPFVEHEQPFWRCDSALWAVVTEHRRADSGETLARPQGRSREMTLSKRNRVGAIAFDGKPVALGDTVRAQGGRSHRISWQGIYADGCKPMKLSIAVRAGFNGSFIDLANNCPGGYYDCTFPASKQLFWVTPRIDFTDDTYAWEGFFVASSEHR